ncbi:organic cation transporter protein-like [Pectinophora gossypiella]|uniref:organic cation transporter protein-like n=1 Tax=Pectinophora gossypiella TaxID=13191 RepID=UPI00214E88C0|nr:organic cation transporter protein-like [Pectinophora gossypiella]XP_049885644.1 organic cation transporter protein-like [Pectinophora gossypiella]
MVQKVLPKMTHSQQQPQKEDVFSKLIGDFGRWQLLVFCTVFLIKLPTGWVQMAIVFLTPRPVFWCVQFANSSAIGANSTCYDDCLRYDYDTSPMESTVVSEWGLICDRAWLASFTQTILQLGVLVGSVIFGFLADRYGRKHTFLLAVVSLICLGLGVPFSPDYVTFTVLRFFLGVATAGTMVVSFVIVMEAIGPRYRELFGCFFHLPFIMGHLLVPLVAFYWRSWDSFLLVLGVSNVLFLGYFFVLVESPRWLLSVHRVEEAANIVTTAANMNKLPTVNIHETLSKLALDSRTVDQPRLNYWALLRPELRVRTACSVVLWLVTGHTYFGFNQYIGQTSPDPFLSVAVTALVQVPANFLAIWMVRQLGRKITAMSSLLICGASIVALGVVPQLAWLTQTLAAIGNGFASVAATCIYIYSSELFPTVVRNMGVGVSSTAMRVGSMIAPFVASLSSTAYWLPTAIFGVTPILAGLVVVLLPETKGRKLPDSIEEVREEKDMKQVMK